MSKFLERAFVSIGCRSVWCYRNAAKKFRGEMWFVAKGEFSFGLELLVGLRWRRVFGER